MTPLIKRFGMFENKTVECIDTNKLFVKSGISIIASLAGEGKTTYIQGEATGWIKKGYEVFHMNFDSAPTYGKDMLNAPVTKKDFEDFFEILKKECDENTIIVIDSLKAMTTMLGLDVENNADMYDLMIKFRSICKISKTSIILVHHVYKPKNVKSMASSFYGSRAIEEQCDSGFILSDGKARIVKSRAGYTRDEEMQIIEVA